MNNNNVPIGAVEIMSLFRYQRKIYSLILAISILLSSSAHVSAEASAKRKKYIAMQHVITNDNDLELYLHRKSLELDLLKQNKIRVRLMIKPLFKEINERNSSFKIDTYEVIEGKRHFLNSQNVTLSRRSSRSRALSIPAGYFNDTQKTLQFDLFDTSNTLVNTYTAEIRARNLEYQIDGSANIDLNNYVCQSTNPYECHLEQFFNRVKFEVRPQTVASTRVIKSPDGFYKVTFPINRDDFRFLGSKVRRKTKVKITNRLFGGANGNDFGLSGFGETISASEINLAENATATISNISTSNGDLKINDQACFDANGSLSIGGCDPRAMLEIGSSAGEIPSIIINPGTLTSTPIDGSLEYDGSDLYFTSGSTRTVIGAQGPAGPAGATGATGATGPQGPQGPAGPSGSLNGGTLNGASLNNNTSVNGLVLVDNNSSLNFYNGSTSTFFNGTYLSFNNGSASYYNNGSTIHLNNGASLNFNGATAEGNITINGDVTANNFLGSFNGTFVGNGSGLTGVTASIAADQLDFDDFRDAMTLDATTAVGMANGDLNFDSTTLYIDSSADNIGIGYSAPSSKLHVNGQVLATSFNGNVYASNMFMDVASNGAITAVVGIGTVNAPVILIAGSGGAVDITANPQIVAGTQGQKLTLMCTSNANTVQLDDGAGLDLSGGLSFTMGDGDIIELIYLNSSWREISRSTK